MTAEVIERIRMCIAEAGGDPFGVRLDASDSTGRSVVFDDRRVPGMIVWRAGELAGMGLKPACWACWNNRATSDCRASQRLVRDCGADR